MKRQHRLLFLCMLVASVALSACSPGHLGGNEIAFVRDGHLWTTDPDGSNSFEVVAGGAPVIGYAWSPDHQMFVFRQLDSSYAATNTGKHLAANALTGLPGDVPASLNTIGIDGGVPLPIMPSSSSVLQSNAWWNNAGNRLLYRQELPTTRLPIDASWWVSQDDQPDGIARKSLPNSYSIPSFTSDSSLAIGNFSGGAFTTTLAGQQKHVIIPGILPGHPLPATLERLLWQPVHSQPLLLYAVLSTSPAPSQGALTPSIELQLRSAQGQTSTIASCACTQFAWSPDGNAILFASSTTNTATMTYTIYSLRTHSSFSFPGEDSSLPYWSPDSHFLLLDGPHALTLVSLANQRTQTLLLDISVGGKKPAAPLPDANAFLQPLSNTIWSADSRSFLVLTRGRLYWQEKELSGGNGLYVATIDANGKPQSTPQLIDAGSDSQPGWGYEDPNTSFLF